ncbi:MAG: gfo/Idh/MocA family oxidoreductase, partial [bacterium]|nr:gfo/Idh/MocA family oxidoreductase [bacterium]
MRETAAGAGLVGLGPLAAAEEKPIQGFDDTETTTQKDKVWEPISDRKIRMGIVGYGVCRFGAAFSLQDHPNIEVVAVSDLFPDRCKALAD